MKKFLVLALLIAAPALATTQHHKFHLTQKQPDPARTLQIQNALVQAGKLSSASGKWDKPTIDALRQIAADHQWQTCHVPDARVINTLGLGASTAGMAAPPVPDGPTILDKDIMKYERDHPEDCTQ